MAPSITCISGEEPFLIEQEYTKTISHFSSLTVDQLPSSIPLSDLIQRIIGGNLFSPSLLFILKNPAWLQTTPSDSELKDLQHLIKELQYSPHHLLISCHFALDARKKVTKTLKESSNFHVFSAFKDWDQTKILEWIPHIAASYGKKITREATWALEQINGHNLQQIKQDIHSVATYIGDAPSITDKDILAMSAPLASSSYKFSEAMKQRDMKTMIKLSKILLETGEDPIRLSGLITSNLRLYLQLASGRQQGLTIDTIATKLSKNSFFLKKIWETASTTYSIPDLVRLISCFATLDVDIKSGKIKPGYGLEQALLSFSPL